MNMVVLSVGLLLGVPSAPKGRQAWNDNLSVIRRFKADPSGFNPHFGKDDPASHSVRFGVGANPTTAPAVRDAYLKDVLHKPRMNTTLQFSVQWKGN